MQSLGVYQHSSLILSYVIRYISWHPVEFVINGYILFLYLQIYIISKDI